MIAESIVCASSGPNMGGKSTLSRSAAAAALLGLCGLLVPCSAMSMPFFDSIMMRGASGDSPLEGKSTFALEMKDLKSILDHTTANSFVAIDELGKGTESDAGASIAAAALEIISQRGALGIFATHFHEIDGMDLNLDRVRKKMMEVLADKSGRARPTWRLCDGLSRDSLALDVARENSVPDYFLQRAKELYESRRQRPTDSPHASSSVTDEPRQDSTPAAGASEQVDTSSSADPVKGRDQLGHIEELMESICQRVLGHEASYGVVRVQPGTNPPPYLTCKSCVYVLHIASTDEVYCGETDDLRGRIAAHRSGHSNISVRGSLSTANFVVLAGVPGKSAARKVETEIITSLSSSSSFDLIGSGDMANVHFGGAAYQPEGNRLDKSRGDENSDQATTVKGSDPGREVEADGAEVVKPSYDVGKDEVGLGGSRFTGGIL